MKFQVDPSLFLLAVTAKLFLYSGLLGLLLQMASLRTQYVDRRPPPQTPLHTTP